MTRALVYMAAILIAGAAQADGARFYPPDGCTGFLTVQSKNCEVQNFYTCEGDAPGDSWRADLGQEGPTYVGKIDYEAQWMVSFMFNPMRKESIVLPASDPASFSDLLEQGLDAFDFKMQTDEGLRRIVGFDRVIENGVEIDGEPLMRTEFSVRVTDEAGDMIYEAEGAEYISARHRRFFAGVRNGRDQVGSFSIDGTPVDFIYPGESGFFSKTPLYGCAALNAHLPLHREDRSHDKI